MSNQIGEIDHFTRQRALRAALAASAFFFYGKGRPIGDKSMTALASLSRVFLQIAPTSSACAPPAASHPRELALPDNFSLFTLQSIIALRKTPRAGLLPAPPVTQKAFAACGVFNPSRVEAEPHQSGIVGFVQALSSPQCTPADPVLAVGAFCGSFIGAAVVREYRQFINDARGTEKMCDVVLETLSGWAKSLEGTTVSDRDRRDLTEVIAWTASFLANVSERTKTLESGVEESAARLAPLLVLVLDDEKEGSLILVERAKTWARSRIGDLSYGAQKIASKIEEIKKLISPQQATAKR